MLHAFLVFLGGGIGAVSRYFAGELIVSWAVRRGVEFPLATLTVNWVGCFLIGVLAGVAQTRTTLTDGLRLFIVVGFLGGFTTFSSFGNETFQLLRDGQHAVAVANALLQMVVGVVLVAFGFWLSGAS